MSVDLSVFEHKRARLQRLTDAKFFAGWVEHLSAGDAHIRIGGGAVITPGETFMVEISGLEKLASFRATLGKYMSDTAQLSIVSGIKQLSSAENARVAVNHFVGTVDTSEEQHEIEVQDISAQGLGVLLAAELQRKVTVTIAIQTPAGQINGTGVVRYCREEKDMPGVFRAGIEFDELGRVEKARWKTLLGDDAA